MDVMPHGQNAFEKTDHSAWYESVYPLLAGRGLWLRGGEMNTLPLEEFHKRPFKVLFTRLSTYADTATSFTHSMLYEIASEIDGCFPDIAYLPPASDVAIFSRGGIPWLLGTQAKMGPKKYDVIGFSNSIVQEILNIPPFLSHSGIPLGKRERMKSDDIPIILLGGANALHSTALWGPDSMIDAVFIGEDPVYVRMLLKVCADGKMAGRTKARILSDLSQVPGVIMPDSPVGTFKRNLSSSSGPKMIERGIMPYASEAIGEGHLQVSEGCRAFCSFCSESWIRKPFREFDPVYLIEKARRLKAEMGLEKVNIFSFNFNMYSHLNDLVLGLMPTFSNVGLKSQRFEMLASDPSMLAWEYALGKTTLSCGLEGISARLRRYLNKGLDEGLLQKSISLVLETKARELKIFLLVTGLEEDQDYSEMERLLDFMRRRKQSAGSGTRVVFSATPLVRFPWTPLEFESSPSSDKCAEITVRIEKCVTRAGFEFREAMGSREYLISQVLARSSDDRMADAIRGAFARTGFVYYRGIPQEYFTVFIRELGARGVEVAELLAGYTYEESSSKKWAAIGTGIARNALWSVCEKNRRFEETRCVAAKRDPGESRYDVDALVKKIAAVRGDEAMKGFNFSVGDRARGITRKYVGHVLAKGMMSADERLIPYFRRYVSSFWGKDSDRQAWLTGDDIITLSWSAQALPILDERIKEKAFLDAVNYAVSGWGELYFLSQETIPEFVLNFVSPFKFDVSMYFKEKGLKYTLYKDTPGSHRYVLTKESLKKGIIASLEAEMPGNVKMLTINLSPGPKFDPEEFTRKVFITANNNDWVRVHVTSLSVGRRDATGVAIPT